MNQIYIDTVRLLLAIAPAVFASGRFAMKGGTALNLFVQEMPRLSVDIDLVFRGTALAVETRSLVGTAQEMFTTDLAVPVLATAELYGSKLVAAMDRQHPRDIFDVQHMLDRFGWQPSFIDCFVVYLAGHNRPVHEVLFPKAKPLEATFTNGFTGMTRDAVELATLDQMQIRLLHELPQQLTPAHQRFLLSLVRGEPAWELMPIQHLRELPALKWKQMNLAKLKKSSAKRFAAQHEMLAERFAG